MYGSGQLQDPKCDLLVEWNLILDFFCKMILRHVFYVCEADLDAWHDESTYLFDHRFGWLDHVLKGQTRGDVRCVGAKNLVQDFCF